ncbi:MULTISPECIES: DUF317 domain-containing protein [unclassified Streptomyces]|uniref:DUF317 domain-containing protein n=1 Tax=unclassified Streptomyces TaxID=2593676 RepID=UPI002E180643|nr:MULTISPECIES: DUF317 domain-containing protein [unclassified Streptomyces]
MQAVLTGPQSRVALVALEAADWSVAATNVLVLARIDHEEPYWAADAAKHLTAEGIAVEVTPRLQEAIDEEWTWPNYPMPWCTRSEIREVSDQAQKIHDAIRHGHLLIHAHARDGHTTVAVGTYLHRGGKSVYLHGEDHLRQIADTFDSPAEALVAFEKVHAAEMRPGPAPLTDTERAAIAARSVFDITTDKSERSRPEPETVPVYLADAGDHQALLDAFLNTHGEFERWRTWSDDTTHVVHESLVLRAEFIHEADPDDTQWKIAAYESPVGERTWHATATTTVPVEIMRVLLESLASTDAVEIATYDYISEASITEATRPLADAGWHHTIEGHTICWQAPADLRISMQLDAFAAHSPHDALPAWTIRGGGDSNSPPWALHFSPHAAASVLHNVAFEVANQLATARPSNTHTTLHVASASRARPAKRR